MSLFDALKKIGFFCRWILYWFSRILICCCRCRNEVPSLQLSFYLGKRLKETLCRLSFYQWTRYFFKNLFTPDTIDKTCQICKKLLKVLEVKKYTYFFFTMENISRWAEIETLKPVFYLLMFYKEDQSLSNQLLLINIKNFMIFLVVE